MPINHPSPDFASALRQQIVSHLSARSLPNQNVTPEMSLRNELHLASLDLLEIVLAFEELYPDCVKGDLNWENIYSVDDLANALWGLQFQTALAASHDPLLQASMRRAAARRRY